MKICKKVLPVYLLIILLSSRAQAQQPTASSEWGHGYGAYAAFDEIAGENNNYWQTVHNQDKGAWWQLDMQREVTLRTVRIAWARYQDRVHSPPASLVVQVSLTGEPATWREVLKLGPEALPRDGQVYDAKAIQDLQLPEPTPARFLRLVFPEGSQPGARYPGYVCLGEVEVPELQQQTVTIEGKFGKAEINIDAPAMVSLYLRGPEGLTSQSLLARRPVVPYRLYGARGPLPWARQAYTYVVTQDGARYESRRQKPAKVEADRGGPNGAVRILGIQLASEKGPETLAIEDWEFSTPGDGSQLLWKIVRRWQQDATVTMAGSPGLFFGFDARHVANSVTSTLWYDPERLDVRASDLCNLVIKAPGRIAETHIQTVLDRDTWAIYKLWTNWHAPVDLRLEVQGGHLYRRGSFAFLSEAGAVTSPEHVQTYRKGQTETIVLTISGVDKLSTGWQLAVSLPDKTTEAALKDFYGSVLNGGAINDQKHFNFGNETDGWYYAGSSWMYGAAIAAGVPAPGRLASHPYDALRAFRGHLARIMSTLDDQGRTHFGYNQTGDWVDDNLHTIQGTYFYLVTSGDLEFVRQQLPAMERMLDYFIRRRNKDGLFELGGVGAHWYYDTVRTSGVNSYYNAFFYKASQDLADMEEAVGNLAKAAEYRRLAAEIKTAFNRVLWREDLPGGPRYLDWIDAQGNQVAYFADLCQWPPIAVGIASPEQARKIVATADARIKELEREYGYRGYASLSALWPVPQQYTRFNFGVYMNGGSLLCMTYWEVVARARAGDHVGAAERLRRFSQHFRETSWAGNNSANIHGHHDYPRSDSGEPYLADMVVVAAATVHGLLGIRPTWKSLEVTPHLPPEWKQAEAEILYKGQRHRIVIEGDKARIQPL